MEKHGLKNLYITNTSLKLKSEKYKLTTLDIAKRLVKYRDEIKLFHVAFHEMLGHGSGKIFVENEKGVKNFVENAKNPLDQSSIT